MLRKLLVMVSLVVLAAAPASAKSDWYEASSDHFVIYAEDSEKDIATFAELLERYHAALAFVTGRKLEKPSPSNRVTIFAVGSYGDLRYLFGAPDSGVAGFYIPGAGKSRAFVQRINLSSGYPDFSLTVLLHEYAHHFLMSASPFGMPRWMNEGAAEFFASASFGKDGGVMIGRPNLHREGELVFGDPTSVRELVDPDRYEERMGGMLSAFYGRSWLLYHYLMFSEDRAGQLRKYQIMLQEGASSLTAAQEAFGDLTKLDRELDDYLEDQKMYSLDLPATLLEAGDITLRKLPAGEAAMMPVQMQSQRGVDEKKAAKVVGKAREIAAQFPEDAGVLTALAEAEFDAGFDEAAIAAADRAIAIDPMRKNAYVQKGYALFHMAESAEDKDAAYALAMKPFAALNKLENDHPLPLIYYYRSYSARGKEPSENARHALERAALMAPFDLELWFQTGLMQAWEGKIALARLSLTPVANSAHGAKRAEVAQLILDKLKTAEEGTPFDAKPILDQVGTDWDDDDGSDDDTSDSGVDWSRARHDAGER